MKRYSFMKKLEKGQVIPLVVLMLFAIIGMIALILDGGGLMSNRRTAQAAADAGQRLAPLRYRMFAFRQKGNDLIVAPERGTGGAAQRLHPLHLILTIADMPDLRARHAGPRRHDEGANVGATA